MSIRGNKNQVLNTIKVQHVLVSVFDKTGLPELIKGILEANPNVIFYSTGGTGGAILKVLGDIPGGSRTTNYVAIEEFTNVPEMEGGLVKTLSPKIHAGILAERGNEAHEKYLLDFALNGGIPGVRFDLVIVNFYDFKAATSKEGATAEDARGHIDIGGPTMVMGSAKNYHSVAVLTKSGQYPGFLAELQKNGGTTLEQRFELAKAAFKANSEYRRDIAEYFRDLPYGIILESIKVMADPMTIRLGYGRQLAYGENRDQSPAHLHPIIGNDDPLAMHRFVTRSGEPSYIAFADGSTILGVMCRLRAAFVKMNPDHIPYIVVAGKHGNPCGVGVHFTKPAAAIRLALAGDRVAIKGGEVITNFPIERVEAEELSIPQEENDEHFYVERGNPEKWGLDLVMAPKFDDDAVEILGQRAKCRLMENPALEAPEMPSDPFELRPVRGGFLKQKAASFVFGRDAILDAEVAKTIPDEHLIDMIIACSVAWCASSNTVALANKGMLIALGCGQQDRIACVRLCITRAITAGHDTEGSTFASDGFFPFAENNAFDRQAVLNAIELLTNADEMDDDTLLLATSNVRNELTRLDWREGPQLLVAAGCRRGVVPFDGMNKEEVKAFFASKGLEIAFVDAIHRGFSKH